MSLLFEKGEAIETGTEGENAIAFDRGEPVRDNGESPFVFEGGVGIGGEFALIYNGTNVGFFETSGSHQDFFDPRNRTSGKPDANGLYDAGVATDNEQYNLDIFAHFSQQEGTFAVGGLLWEKFEDTGADYTVRYGDFAVHDGSLVAFEGSSSGDDIKTDGDDRLHDGFVGARANGDAAAFKADGSFTSTISYTGDASSLLEIVVVGPDDRLFTGSTSVDVDIVGN